MEYKTKSVIIGRMKRPSNEDTKVPCFVALFDVNDPHKTGDVPKKRLEFQQKDRIDIKGMDVSYLLAGNDLVINNLESISVEEYKNDRLRITGKQKS